MSHARVGILTGSGKAFKRGHGFGDARGDRNSNLLRKSGRFTAHGEDVPRIWSFSKPLIAAVNGAALAGGCGIATTLRFYTCRAGSEIRYTEVKIGFLPAIVSVFCRGKSVKKELATFCSPEEPRAAKPRKSADQ